MANDGHPPTRPDGTNHGVSRNTPTAPDRVLQTTETMWKCSQLRSAGVTFREIGETLSIDPSWARTLVLRALDASRYESADLMRTQEGMRLDRLQRAHWALALGGDAKAAAVCIRVMERRARLFGLDAPFQAEVGVVHSTATIDAEVATLVALLADAQSE